MKATNDTLGYLGSNISKALKQGIWLLRQ